MIRIKHLSKAYGNHQVLRDINLEFEPGHVYGIVGANGAGKTTLFRSIAGIENHDGEVEYANSPLKNDLGFLDAQPIMMSKITGWEYLKLVLISRGIAEENFESQNLFDLPLGQYAETYSTGMKKKLALTGILLQANQVLILDEPFNGVDIQSNLIIIELIKKLKALNKIILISSHIFSTLSETCDQIHLLKEGVIEKSVLKKDFTALESEMKDIILGNQLKQINLR